MARAGDGSIGSAVGRLLAVLDDRAAADAAAAALTASGFAPADLQLLAGDTGAAAFDPSGKRRGLPGRLARIVEFSWADQAPDFAWYEAAIRQGRLVLSVRVRGQTRVAEAAGIVTANGGHFVNHYGWFETQELARWRGPEPDVPGFLRR